MIDVSKITYSLYYLTPQGVRIDLTSFLRSLGWEENEGELAVRLEAELQQQELPGNKWLSSQVQLGGQILLYADWGAGPQEVFRGTVFVWDYQTDPLGHFTITAYDQLIYLMKSEDDRFYKAGQTAKAIIQDIAKAWKIPLGDIQGPNTSLAKQAFRGDSLADMISSVLDEAKKKGGGKWIVRSKQGKIDIVKPGQNTPVYLFTQDTNVESIENRQDIEDLVTRVKITGAEDKEGKAPVVATLDGRTEFGVLQKVVSQRQFDTPAAAKSAAQDILKESGQPQKHRKVQTMDLPFLRKGDKVKIAAGTIVGDFYVTGVMHDATNQMMSLEVEDIG